MEIGENVAQESHLDSRDLRSLLDASGWTRTTGTSPGGRSYQLMTENERRAQDVLTREDVVRRILVAGGMIASFLSILLVVNP
jgi:hypothetical protein